MRPCLQFFSIYISLTKYVTALKKPKDVPKLCMIEMVPTTLEIFANYVKSSEKVAYLILYHLTFLQMDNSLQLITNDSNKCKFIHNIDCSIKV